MSSLALACVMRGPAVTAPIIGPRCVEHLAPAREALDIHLTVEEREALSGLFPR